MTTAPPARDATPATVRTRSSARAAVASVLRALLTTTALVYLYFAMPLAGRLTVSAGAFLGLGLLVFTVLAAVQFTSIVRARSPMLRAFEVLGVTVPFLLLLFSSTYYLVGHNNVAAFSQPLTRLDALYFTVTVFATVGFGDITAVTQAARIAVTVQMVADLVVIGIGVRLLAGAVRRGLARRDETELPAPPR